MSTNHAALLDLVIDRAPKLRERGVLEVGITDTGAITFKLAPFEPESSIDTAPKTDETDDIWQDQDLYGRGSVPGKQRKEKTP